MYRLAGITLPRNQNKKKHNFRSTKGFTLRYAVLHLSEPHYCIISVIAALINSTSHHISPLKHQFYHLTQDNNTFIIVITTYLKVECEMNRITGDSLKHVKRYGTIHFTTIILMTVSLKNCLLWPLWTISCHICDPIPQKVHLVGQVNSEIMYKMCKI